MRSCANRASGIVRLSTVVARPSIAFAWATLRADSPGSIDAAQGRRVEGPPRSAWQGQNGEPFANQSVEHVGLDGALDAFQLECPGLGVWVGVPDLFVNLRRDKDLARVGLRLQARRDVHGFPDGCEIIWIG